MILNSLGMVEKMPHTVWGKTQKNVGWLVFDDLGFLRNVGKSYLQYTVKRRYILTDIMYPLGYCYSCSRTIIIVCIGKNTTV